MELLITLTKIGITGIYLFYLIRSIKNRLYMEGTVIASLYSILATMVGQDSGKIIVTIVLYCVLTMIFFNHLKRNDPSVKLKSKKQFSVVLYLFFIYFIIVSLISPALGYDYFNNKTIHVLLEIFIPCFLLILFSKYSSKLDFNVKYLLSFFEIISLFTAFLLLLNAFNIGIGNILNSTFMVRVGAEEANVIWIGRFISLGFLSVILKKGSLLTRGLELLILMLAMVLTGSKAVLIFPLIALFIYILFFKRSKKKKIGLLAIIGLIVVGFLTVLSYLNPLAVQRRFSMESNTIEYRQGSMELVYKDFFTKNNVFFGNGTATSGYPLVQNYDQVAYPHNITIEMLYETGVIGVILYYLVLLVPLFLYFKNRKFTTNNEEIAISATMVVLFLLYAQTSGNLIGNTSLFVFAGYLNYVAK